MSTYLDINSGTTTGFDSFCLIGACCFCTFFIEFARLFDEHTCFFIEFMHALAQLVTSQVMHVALLVEFVTLYDQAVVFEVENAS
jgi:hypothetical protein